jgi:hypothetical protein
MKSADVRDAIFGAIYPKLGPQQYSLRDISKATGVSAATICRFMAGRPIHTDKQDALIDWLRATAEPHSPDAG